MSDTSRPALRTIAVPVLRPGATALGGPAAHVAMLHGAVVTRGRRLDDPRFLDLLGAAQLIPGPNSTAMTLYLGHAR